MSRSPHAIERHDMKTRMGFVSNSSSSSFVLFGRAFSKKEIAKACAEVLKMSADEISKDPDSYSDEVISILDYIEKSSGIRLHAEDGIGSYYDMVVIGALFDQMNDDESKKDFLSRIGDALNTVFPLVDNAEIIVDGGY